MNSGCNIYRIDEVLKMWTYFNRKAYFPMVKAKFKMPSVPGSDALGVIYIKKKIN